MLTSQFSLTGKLRLLTLLTTFFIASTGYSQSCAAAFSVENDRNVDSADEDGAQFVVNIKNNGSQTTTYELRSVFQDTSCSTQNRSSQTSNVRLNVAFFSSVSGSQQINRIKVSPGQSVQMKVNITVPAGTLFNRWSCIQLEAFDPNCSSVAGSQLLRVFVPDPSEE